MEQARVGEKSVHIGRNAVSRDHGLQDFALRHALSGTAYFLYLVIG
jgi:hypothetical protein